MVVVHVSNFGRVRTGRGVVHRGHVRDGYHRVTVCRHSHTLHVLVAEAFLGPRPTAEHTVDHIDGDTHNNAVINLRWATKSEQSRNAYRLHPHRPADKRSFPVEARPVGQPSWVRFESAHEAARQLGASQGNVQSCLHGRRRTTKGHEFRLVATPVLPGERWADADGVRVSDLGRVRTARGHVHCGHCGGAKAYRSVTAHGASRYVHVLVAKAFLPPPPSALHTVDHVNNDPKDNRACNLRWATPSEQVRHSYASNEARGSHVGKTSKPVRGRSAPANEWTVFSGLNDAARRTGIPSASLLRATRTGRTVGGWEFEYVPFDDIEGEVWKEVCPRSPDREKVVGTYEE